MCSDRKLALYTFLPYMQVLRNQVKADVFDMVKNLNLPVLQGDTALLKKLQALGLHSNR